MLQPRHVDFVGAQLVTTSGETPPLHLFHWQYANAEVGPGIAPASTPEAVVSLERLRMMHYMANDGFVAANSIMAANGPPCTYVDLFPNHPSVRAMQAGFALNAMPARVKSWYLEEPRQK